MRAILLHGAFLKINLFIDGNGRTLRLLLNFKLIKNGYTPIIIKNEYRAKYYDVLNFAHTTMNYESFINLVSELIIESERLWLSVLE